MNKLNTKIILEAKSVAKKYYLGNTILPVLKDVSVKVQKSEWISILGTSGSGKSTLLHLLGGLDTPDKDSGPILFNNYDITQYKEKSLDSYRRNDVGFVFQFYHLLPELNVLENTLLPAKILQNEKSEKTNYAKDLLEKFGLELRLKHKPKELSGGERQRVAIARALINKPQILLADEPTGNLDKHSGQHIIDILREENNLGLTILMVTHDEQIAKNADRTIYLTEGKINTK